MREELSPEVDAAWPNCTIADCANKACLALSETLCFPHYFNLRMNDEGNAIYPDEVTERFCLRRLDLAQREVERG